MCSNSFHQSHPTGGTSALDPAEMRKEIEIFRMENN
jgi:hypothetical protein